MEHGNEYFVYGAVWKQYLLARNTRKKRTLLFRQLKCLKCKVINEPLDGTVHALCLAASGGLEATMTCSQCGRVQKRLYKRVQHQKLHDTFSVLHDGTGLLYDSSSSPNKTHLVEGEHSASCESSKNALISPTNTYTQAVQPNLLEYQP